MMRPLPHTYTTAGTTCDIRGPYWNASSGLDCAANCGQDSIDTNTYPECARKLDECFRVFNGQELGAVPPVEPDDGPYGSFAADGVVVGSACEFLRYVNLHKPERCPPPPADTQLFCASGTCSTTQNPPTPAPTAALTLAPSGSPTTLVSKVPTPQEAPTTAPPPSAPSASAPTSVQAPTSLPTSKPTSNRTAPTNGQTQQGEHVEDGSDTHWYVFAIVASVLLLVITAVCYRQYKLRKEQVVPLVADTHFYSPLTGGIQ